MPFGAFLRRILFYNPGTAEPSEYSPAELVAYEYELARRYGVSEHPLYRWRDDFLAGGEAALAGKQGKGQQQRIQELEREVEQRDQVIGELTIANRVLKKVSDRSS